MRVRNTVDTRFYDNAALGSGPASVYGDIKDLTGTREVVDILAPQRSAVVVEPATVVGNVRE